MIVVLLLAIGAVILGISWKFNLENWNLAGWVVCIVTLIIGVAIWIPCYMISLTDVTDMETFYDVNRKNYEITIDQTREAVICLNSMGQFQVSVENLSQSTNWSERIKELRDGVVEYNKELRRLKMWNSIIWIDWFFVDPPERLKLIKLER